MGDVVARMGKIRKIFDSFTDNDEKWKYIIELGKGNKGFSDVLKSEDTLINGCSSRIYMVSGFKDNLVHFEIDSISTETKPLISIGLCVLALQIFNDCTPADILSVPPKFFTEIGLNVGLSPTRTNGFASVLNKIYLYAKYYADNSHHL